MKESVNKGRIKKEIKSERLLSQSQFIKTCWGRKERDKLIHTFTLSNI